MCWCGLCGLDRMGLMSEGKTWEMVLCGDIRRALGLQDEFALIQARTGLAELPQTAPNSGSATYAARSVGQVEVEHWEEQMIRSGATRATRRVPQWKT